MNPHQLVEFNNPSLESFREILASLAKLLSGYDLKLPPYSCPKLKWYGALDFDGKMKAYSMASTFLRVCLETQASGASLRDNRVFLWRGLKDLGFHFENDLFDRIREEDLIEVYDANNVGVFRNIKFYDFVSYPMEEIYCRPWPELFHRPDADKTVQLIKATQTMVGPNGGKPIDMSMNGHTRVIETESPERLKMDVLVKSLLPLFDEYKKVSAFVVVEHAVSRGSDLTREEETISFGQDRSSSLSDVALT